MVKNMAKWQTIYSLATFLLSLIQVAILARLVSLSDFGLVAIVMMIINMSQVLSDLGMANYLVYRQDISEKLNSTVFWVCSVSGSVLIFILVMLSPVISNVYDNDRVGELLALIALNFIPISLSAQLQARYVANFKVNTLSFFDLVSKVLGLIISVSVALLGFGAESLISGVIASSSIKCIFIWFFAEKDWKPTFMFCKSEAKNALGYGVYQVGSQLINQYRANLDTLLLGIFVSPAQLGAYNLAKQLIQKPAALILPIIQKITLPFIASLQENRDELRSLINKSHVYLSIFLIFPYILLCFLNKDVVTIMYGPEKQEAVSLLVIPLSLFWLFRTIGGGLVGPLTQGLGKTKRDFYWNLSVSGLFTIFCVLLAPISEYALAWGLSILQFLLMNIIYMVFYRSSVELKYFSYIYPILTFHLLSFISVFISSEVVSFLKLNIYLNSFLITILSMFLYYLFGYKFAVKLVEIPNFKSFIKGNG